MRKRFFLMENPAAGITGSRLVEEVVRELAGQGACVTRARGCEDAMAVRERARAAGRDGAYDAIVAAGGDGTIRQVAAALLGSETDLGIIPVGTGNVLAHEIGLAPTASAVVRMLRDGPAVRMACAEANGEPFLLMVGVGLDARVVGALDQRLKSRLGRAAYAGPLLGAIMRSADRLTVEIDDGCRHSASWAVIANARHYGGGLVLAPRTGIRERGLQAVLFKTRNRAVLLGQLVGLLARRRLEPSDGPGSEVVSLPCSRVRITAQQAVPTQIDGDVLGATPVAVDAGNGEVRLIVPVAA